jgi:hypothetical protein
MIYLLATSDGSEGGAIIASFIVLALGLTLWLLPGFIASGRKHHNRFAIWLVTILLGWSGIGWLVALIWAFTNPPPNPTITINNQR